MEAPARAIPDAGHETGQDWPHAQPLKMIALCREFELEQPREWSVKGQRNRRESENNTPPTTVFLRL